MIEAYAIGVSLSLKGNIASEIAGVGRQFEALNRIIASSQMAVNELAAGMRGLARVGKSAADSWQQAAGAMERAAKAASKASGSMRGSAPSGAAGVAPASSFAAPNGNDTSQSRALVPWASQSRALVPWSGGFSTSIGPTGGGSAASAYIGSRGLVPYNGGTFWQQTGLATSNGGTFAGGPGTGAPGSAGTSLMAAGGFGGSGMPPLSVPPWAAGYNAARPGSHDFALAAAGAGVAGEAMVGTVGEALKAEMEVRTQLAALRMNTKIGDDDVKRARELGEKITRDVPGSTLAENIHHIADLFTVMGDMHEAMEGAPEFAKAAYLFKSIPGQHKGDSSFAAAQAIEVMQRHTDASGKVNMGSFNQQMNAMLQVAYGTGGRLDGSSYLGFAKQSRVGGMVANDQYLYRDLPAMLIALGGNRSGTGDAAVWNQFVTGKMTANAFEALQGAGIIDKDADWQHGQVLNMEKHLKNAGGFGANRVQWMRDTFFGADGVFARNGIDPNNKLQTSQFLSKWASRATGLGFMSEGVLGMNNIDKEAGKIDTTTRDPLSTLQKYDPSQSVREFQSAMNGLMVALGKEALGPALETLKSLTNAINAFADFADKHPDIASFGMKALAGMGALALGFSALSGAFLVAPAMWRVASWLVLSNGIGQTGVALTQFAAGSAAGAALRSLPGLLMGLAGSMVRFAAQIGVVHMGVTAVDPNDRAGSWIDKNIPGAGAVDDFFARHLGIGRTFDEQRKAAPDLYQNESFRPPTGSEPMNVQLKGDVMMDGRKVGSIAAEGIARQAAGPSTGTTGFDVRSGVVGGLQALP